MILRYPGGKKKVAKYLARALGPCQELREPFFGSGAVTFAALSGYTPPKTVWINDKDTGIASLFTAVIQSPEDLIARVRAFVPSVEAFKDFKASLLDSTASLSLVEQGFRKLAVHQMSFSGLGTKAGSPIGGWTQGTDRPKTYDVGCRWNGAVLIRHIQHLNSLLQGRVHEDRCTSYDALSVIQAPGEDVIIYADPPYVGAGEALYQVAYTEAQHRELAKTLLTCPYRWMLSYDDHPLVRELYASELVEPTSWAYTINSQTGNAGRELLILHRVGLPIMPRDEVDLISELFGS